MLLSTAAGSVLDLVYPLAEVFTRVQVTEFKPFVTVVGQFLPWVKCEVSAPIYRENFSCFHPHPPINPLPPPYLSLKLQHACQGGRRAPAPLKHDHISTCGRPSHATGHLLLSLDGAVPFQVPPAPGQRLQGRPSKAPPAARGDLGPAQAVTAG